MTLEKGFQLVQMAQTGKSHFIVSILIFWTIYMHAMWLAFRTEGAAQAGGRPGRLR